MSTVVINSNLLTNSKSRPQTLTNGWIINMVFDASINSYYIYKSMDNGVTWILLCWMQSTNFLQAGGSFVTYGNNIYVLVAFGSLRMYFWKIDATTVTAMNINIYAIEIDPTQSSFGNNCSLAVSNTGVLTGVWCSKNGINNYNFGLRSAKSTDGGITWTKQDGSAGIDQITLLNSVNADVLYPSVVYNKNDSVVILFSTQYYYFYNNTFMGAYTGDYSLTCVIPGIQNNAYISSGWEFATVTSNQNYFPQYNSITLLKKYGANIGRIWTAWQGRDETDYNFNNIRVAYSDDNGVTWSTMAKITSGNTIRQNATLTEKQNGDIICMYDDGTNVIYQTCNNGMSNFSTPITIGVGTNPSISDAINNMIGFTYKTSNGIIFDKFVFWNAPNIKTKIDGNLKSYSNGWVKIDGVLRQIDSMWTKIDGLLKKL